MKSNRTALRSSAILCFASCLSLVVGCAGGTESGNDAGSSSGAGGSHGNAGATGAGSGGSTTGGGGAGGSPTTTGSGGATGTAGSTGGGSGGAPGTGGTPVTGGGGAIGTGGKTGAGGMVGMGGTTGAGGKTGPCDIWLAPNGSDTNPGTVDAPMATLAAGYNRLCPGVGGAQPGDLCSGTLTTMCLKAGTYPMSARFQTKKERMGTPTRIITFMPDPAATTKPVLDFATQPRVTSCPSGTVASAPISGTDQNNHGGIDLISDYYKIQGLEIKNSNGWGVSIQGSHSVVQDLDVHNNGDCGISIRSGSGIASSGSFNTVLNCDSHQNDDVACQGANADGLCAKEGQGAGNVFDGCRSWDNADDGIDLFAWPDPVTVRNSWMFGMGATTAGSGSNGNGFKMGGNKVSAKHLMSNDFAFDNNETAGGAHVSDWGFTNNSNPASMTCTGCGAWNNRGGSFQNITSSGGVSATSVTTAKAAAAKRNADGSLPDITKL
jgi:hypothetical protein